MHAIQSYDFRQYSLIRISSHQRGHYNTNFHGGVELKFLWRSIIILIEKGLFSWMGVESFTGEGVKPQHPPPPGRNDHTASNVLVTKVWLWRLLLIRSLHSDMQTSAF